MADQHSRELERLFHETGGAREEALWLISRARSGEKLAWPVYARLHELDLGVAAAYLRRRLDAGDLTDERLRLASYCGHPAAELLVPVPQSEFLPDWVWGAGYRQLGEAFRDDSPARSSFFPEVYFWTSQALLEIASATPGGPTELAGLVPLIRPGSAPPEALTRTTRQLEAQPGYEGYVFTLRSLALLWTATHEVDEIAAGFADSLRITLSVADGDLLQTLKSRMTQVSLDWT